jgi:transposase
MVQLWKLSWAERMRSVLFEMKAYKDKDISSSEPAVTLSGKPAATCCDMETYGKFSACRDECVQDGKHELAQMQKVDFGYVELRKMVAGLTSFKANHMLFLADYSVPFTNNLAERDLRLCKLKENISKTFRSWNGAKRYAVVSSAIATALRSNLPVFTSLVSLLGRGAEL